MTAAQFLPSRCRCGAPGFLEPVPQALLEPAPPEGGWQFQIEADALPVAPPPRNYAVAAHEASHAIVAHIAGFKIVSATVDWQPQILSLPGGAGSALARVAVALSGDHGQRLITQRLEYRPPNPDLIASFNIVRALEFGGCDACLAALYCFAALSSDAADADLLSTYRQAEALTIQLLQDRAVQKAVRVLAGLLFLNGSLAGPDVHQCLSAVGQPFGWAAKQFNQPEN